jgi:hypothetical protein
MQTKRAAFGGSSGKKFDKVATNGVTENKNELSGGSNRLE